MKKPALKRRTLDLGPRLDAVRTLAELGEGRLPAQDLLSLQNLVQRADERLSFGGASTVVALAGATGSGKSSLFNALVGSPVSQVGVRRPTTARTSAAVWESEGSDDLLDWLDVEHRHRVDDEALAGLVLLDLPDHDSTQSAHRGEVDRLVELVDIFVWVVDPQKYADALLHDRYLRPLARHAAVTLVFLNQTDRLTKADSDRCAADLARLLSADGLRDAKVLAGSAVTGEGVSELKNLVARRVDEERAAAERLAADFSSIADRFAPLCGGDPVAGIKRGEKGRLVRALAEAAGVETLAEAAGRSYARSAKLATGWMVTRWVRRLRPDPLGRLHLGEGSGGRTSAPPIGELGRARIAAAQREVAIDAADGLPDPWPQLLRERAAGSLDPLLQDVDRAVGRADLRPTRNPWWWSLGSLLQKLFLVVLVAGFLWLGVLFALAWFQIPDPPTPEIRGIPWPTLLFFGGLLLGFLSSVIFGLFARVGARRVKRRARASVEDELESVAQERVIDPVEKELADCRRFCSALKAARSA